MQLFRKSTEKAFGQLIVGPIAFDGKHWVPCMGSDYFVCEQCQCFLKYTTEEQDSAICCDCALELTNEVEE